MAVNPDVVAAFFAGVAAVLSSLLSIWLVKRSARQECDERLEAFRKGLHEMEHDGP
jgi:hypothetical protein